MIRRRNRRSIQTDVIPADDTPTSLAWPSPRLIYPRLARELRVDIQADPNELEVSVVPLKTNTWFLPRRTSNGGTCVETLFTEDSVFVRNNLQPHAGTATFTHE